MGTMASSRVSPQSRNSRGPEKKGRLNVPANPHGVADAMRGRLTHQQGLGQRALLTAAPKLSLKTEWHKRTSMGVPIDTECMQNDRRSRHRHRW